MCKFCIVLSAFLSIFFAILHAEIDRDKIYVIANTAVEDSENLAREYCSMRGIPLVNIIALPMSQKGFVTRAEYFFQIENPIIEELCKRGAINAQPINTTLKTERSERAFISHDIDFIVLCRGVPWGIASSDRSNMSGRKPSIKSDAASVDSELSAAFLSQKTPEGPVKNPVFSSSDPNSFKIFGLLRIARLDGATSSDVLSALYGTMEAESKGLRGRAYIDKSKKMILGDKWLDGCISVLEKLGYDTDVEPTPSLFGYNMRMDYPAFYFGWYSARASGYFTVENFRLSQGAVGMHIYSFSAYDLRATPRSTWATTFVGEGASLTTGNVFEPFLQFTHRFDLLMEGLAKGLRAGEAAYFSLPSLSWQDTFLGDPLYKPFKKSLEKQIADIDFGRTDKLSQYAVIRKMNIISRGTGGDVPAMEFGKQYLGKLPENTALLWKMSILSKRLGDHSFSKYFAEKCAEKIEADNPEWAGLGMEIASLFVSEKDVRAMAIYEAIAKMKNPPIGFKLALTDAARKASKILGIRMSENLETIARQTDEYRAEVRRRAEEIKAKKEIKEKSK